MDNNSNNSGLPGATPAQPEKAQTSETLTRADLDAYFADFRSKINGELAGLRKAVKGGGEAQASSPVAPQPATIEDIKLSREIGRLEVELGQEVLASLGDEYETASVAEQARMLRIAKNLSASIKPVETIGNPHRGETPISVYPTSARAQAPAVRSSVPVPRTKAEFLELKKKDPQAAHALYSDPAFDPTSLR